MTSLCGLEGGATEAAVGAAVDCHLRVECLLPAGSLGTRRVVAEAEDHELSRHGYRNGVSVLESRREAARDEDMRRERNPVSYPRTARYRKSVQGCGGTGDAPPPPRVLRVLCQGNLFAIRACSAPASSSRRRSPRLPILNYTLYP